MTSPHKIRRWSTTQVATVLLLLGLTAGEVVIALDSGSTSRAVHQLQDQRRQDHRALRSQARHIRHLERRGDSRQRATQHPQRGSQTRSRAVSTTPAPQQAQPTPVRRPAVHLARPAPVSSAPTHTPTPVPPSPARPAPQVPAPVQQVVHSVCQLVPGKLQSLCS